MTPVSSPARGTRGAEQLRAELREGLGVAQRGERGLMRGLGRAAPRLAPRHNARLGCREAAAPCPPALRAPLRSSPPPLGSRCAEPPKLFCRRISDT
jgi:hypothetical protein